jgi:hypothetical protein
MSERADKSASVPEIAAPPSADIRAIGVALAGLEQQLDAAAWRDEAPDLIAAYEAAEEAYFA